MSSTRIRKYATRIVAEVLNTDTSCSRMLMAILETSPAAVINAARTLDDTKMQTHAFAYDEAKLRTPLNERFVIACLVKRLNVIASIKAYREFANAGLKEAKDFVEHVAKKRSTTFGTLDHTYVNVGELVKLAKGMKD